MGWHWRHDMSTTTPDSAYDFELVTIDGAPLKLSDFRGQVLLVVNTASNCAFTTQYKPLCELYSRYGARGFSVIGVPSDDFNQELASNEEVKRFCTINYFVNFPLASKTHVRGKKAHPFYQWLKKQGGWFSGPSWNFHKYLIGTDGKLISWHMPSTSPLSKKITSRIEQQLQITP